MRVPFETPTDVVEPIPRRVLLWTLIAMFASVAVAMEIYQRPDGSTPKLPSCEALPNPFDPAFSPAFGGYGSRTSPE